MVAAKPTRVLLPSLALVAIAGGLVTGVVDTAAVGLVTAGAILGSAVGLRERSDAVAIDPLHPARTELARARRCAEQADVMVVPLPREGPPPREVAATLRVTDGVAASRNGDGWELCAVIADADRDTARQSIERRLLAAANGELAVGWATFPDEGLTLDDLLDLARDRARATAPVTDPSPALHQLRRAAPWLGLRRAARRVTEGGPTP